MKKISKTLESVIKKYNRIDLYSPKLAACMGEISYVISGGMAGTIPVVMFTDCSDWKVCAGAGIGAVVFGILGYYEARDVIRKKKN